MAVAHFSVPSTFTVLFDVTGFDSDTSITGAAASRGEPFSFDLWDLFGGAMPLSGSHIAGLLPVSSS